MEEAADVADIAAYSALQPAAALVLEPLMPVQRQAQAPERPAWAKLRMPALWLPVLMAAGRKTHRLVAAVIRAAGATLALAAAAMEAAGEAHCRLPQRQAAFASPARAHLEGPCEWR